MDRDNFNKTVIDAVSKRASYICSNPDCNNMTLCASDDSPEKFIYVGKVAHITAAAKNGPRYNDSITAMERKSATNAIFLCSNCADMVDKNNGLDFSIEKLRQWKNTHEQWIRDNLNKSPQAIITVIDGEHKAIGVGNVTAIKTNKPTFFKPGTKSIAEGIGRITATHIGGNDHE